MSNRDQVACAFVYSTFSPPRAVSLPSNPTSSVSRLVCYRMESATASQLYDFAVEVPSRRPRPWERAPQSPIKSHRHGKKVWKRFQTRPKEAAQTRSKFEIHKAAQELEATAHTPGRRPVKRLRNAPDLGTQEGASTANRFTTTLREKAPGTPKSRVFGVY